MDQKTFAGVAGAIFAFVALAHLFRIVMGWSVAIDGWDVPVWASWIAVIVSGGLSYFGLRIAARG